MAEYLNFTIDEFKSIKFEELNQIAPKVCNSYSDYFTKKVSSDLPQNIKNIYLFLYHITSLHFTAENPQSPFTPSFIIKTKRSFALDDINSDHIQKLLDIYDHINDHEIKARIADIIWIKNKDYKIANQAVISYIESAKIVEDQNNWTFCIERITRAMQIASMLGRKNESFLKVLLHVEDTIKKYNGNDPLYLTSSLMKILQTHKHGNPEFYLKIIENNINNALTNKEYIKYRHYLEIKAKWFSILKNNTQKFETLKTIAESFIDQLNLESQKDNHSKLLLTNLLQQSIEAYRRIPNTHEKIDELHKLLIKYEKEAMDEMQLIQSEPFDLTEYIEKAEQHIKSNSLLEAIIKLALIVNSPKKEKLKTKAQNSMNKFVLQHLFQGVIVSETGKIIQKKPSALSDNPKDNENLLIIEMYEEAKFEQQINVMAFILPALEQIIRDHEITCDGLSEILNYNPFIPPERVTIYAKGLYYGLIGDFIISSHLLIPQIENSIRYILNNINVVTSTLDDEGNQEEKNLNSLLYCKELNKLLGDDIIFDLQGLLIEKFGTNLRNRTAHGMIDYIGYTYSDVYLWWLTLKICVLPKLKTN